MCELVVAETLESSLPGITEDEVVVVVVIEEVLGNPELTELLEEKGNTGVIGPAPLPVREAK